MTSSPRTLYNRDQTNMELSTEYVWCGLGCPHWLPLDDSLAVGQCIMIGAVTANHERCRYQGQPESDEEPVETKE